MSDVFPETPLSSPAPEAWAGDPQAATAPAWECPVHPMPEPLPLPEYARQLEAQLADAGKELIRLASAEREAREELAEVASRPGAPPRLGRLLAARRDRDEARGQLAACRAELAEVRRIAYMGGQSPAFVRSELLAYLEAHGGIDG